MNAEAAYLFRHALLRDAAYQLQLPSRRAGLHALVFRSVESLFGGPPPDPPPLDRPFAHVAPHATDPYAAELAEHARVADDPAFHACRLLYLRRAAEHAERSFRHPDAFAAWQRFADLAPSGDDRGAALRRAGIVAVAMGRTREARPLFERALALHRASGHRRLEGVLLANLATLDQHAGRTADAERGYGEALALMRETGERRGEAVALGNLANLLLETGRADAAEPLFRASLAAHRALGERRSEALALGNLGNLLRARTRLDEAERLMREALDLHLAAGAKPSAAVVLGNLSLVLHRLGRHAEAESATLRSLALHREAGDLRGEAVALVRRAADLQLAGRSDDSERHALRALSLLRDVGIPRFEAAALANYAELLAAVGRSDESDARWREALSILARLGDRRTEGDCLCGYASLLVRLGRIEEARSAWARGAELLREQKDEAQLASRAEPMRKACAEAGVAPLDARESPGVPPPAGPGAPHPFPCPASPTREKYSPHTERTPMAKITISNGKLNVPDCPTLPFIRGDGTGPDIWAASVRVFDAAVQKAYRGKRKVDWMEVYAGETAFQKFNSWLPDATVQAFKDYLVGIKGPLTTPVGKGIRSLNVALRQMLDLYVCLRPVRWFTGVPSPVKHPEKVDMVIFRENTEDIYAGIEYQGGSPEAQKVLDFIKKEFPKDFEKIRFGTEAKNEEFWKQVGAPHYRKEVCVGVGIKPVSWSGTVRLVHTAIAYALQHKRKSVTLVHKGNIMKYTEGAFRDWGYEIAEKYFGDQVYTWATWEKTKAAKGEDAAAAEQKAALAAGKVLIKDSIADITLQQVLTRPEDFDVIATLNLNGDYLSDALAAQVGGIGIAPGGNINYISGHAIFEATHGTAPKYANQDKVNPGSVLLSGEMMFRYMGWTEAADLIIKGLEGAIGAKTVTYDFARLMEGAKEVKCSQFGTETINRM